MELFIKNVTIKDAKTLMEWWKFHNTCNYELGKEPKYNYIYVPRTVFKNNKLGNIYREEINPKKRV